MNTFGGLDLGEVEQLDEDVVELLGDQVVDGLRADESGQEGLTNVHPEVLLLLVRGIVQRKRLRKDGRVVLKDCAPIPPPHAR
jgi:hypothetical protein